MIEASQSRLVTVIGFDEYKKPFNYLQPSCNGLIAKLVTLRVAGARQYHDELPTACPKIAETLQREIAEMESKWPV
jgi:hypothetical protein